MISFRTVSLCIGLALICFAAFGYYFAALTGGRSLDFVFTVAGLKSVIAAYTPDDVTHHLRGTGVWDTIFPFIYGSAVICAVIRYTKGRLRKVLIAMTLLAIAADFAENVLNVVLLTGGTLYLPHVVATWVKFAALAVPLFVGLRSYAADLLGRQSRQS